MASAVSTGYLNSSCAACVFGAVQTSILSYTSLYVETFAVSVIPHITVFADGSETTSYESHTDTDFYVVPAGSGPALTYTDPSELTWTVGDATLTYPTTYVQYLRFAGATGTVTASQSICAEDASLTTIDLPTATHAASAIFPTDADVDTSTALPAPLLGYLESLDTIESAFGNQSLQTCGSLPLYTEAGVFDGGGFPTALQVTHATAYIMVPVTGRAIVTTLPVNTVHALPATVSIATSPSESISLYDPLFIYTSTVAPAPTDSIVSNLMGWIVAVGQPPESSHHVSGLVGAVESAAKAQSSASPSATPSAISVQATTASALTTTGLGAYINNGINSASAISSSSPMESTPVASPTSGTSKTTIMTGWSFLFVACLLGSLCLV